MWRCVARAQFVNVILEPQALKMYCSTGLEFDYSKSVSVPSQHCELSSRIVIDSQCVPELMLPEYTCLRHCLRVLKDNLCTCGTSDTTFYLSRVQAPKKCLRIPKRNKQASHPSLVRPPSSMPKLQDKVVLCCQAGKHDTSPTDVWAAR